MREFVFKGKSSARQAPFQTDAHSRAMHSTSQPRALPDTAQSGGMPFSEIVRQHYRAHTARMIASGQWHDAPDEPYDHACAALSWALEQRCGNSFASCVLIRLAYESEPETGTVTMTTAELLDRLHLKPTPTPRTVKAALNILVRLRLISPVGKDTYAFGVCDRNAAVELAVGAHGKIPLHLPKKVKLAVLERDGWACRQCGATEVLQVDHITARANGGCHELANLQTLCGPCNAKKGTS